MKQAPGSGPENINNAGPPRNSCKEAPNGYRRWVELPLSGRHCRARGCNQFDEDGWVRKLCTVPKPAGRVDAVKTMRVDGTLGVCNLVRDSREINRCTLNRTVPADPVDDMTGGRVRFRWRDYRHHDKSKVMALAADEFIRRFLLHTLPDGFHRIRHYGFLGNRHRVEKLALCQGLLAVAPVAPLDTSDKAGPLQDHSFDTCPICSGRMEVVGLLPRSCPADPSAWHDSS